MHVIMFEFVLINEASSGFPIRLMIKFFSICLFFATQTLGGVYNVLLQLDVLSHFIEVTSFNFLLSEVTSTISFEKEIWEITCRHQE